MKKNTIVIVGLILVVAISLYVVKTYKSSTNKRIDHVVVNSKLTANSEKYLTDNNGMTLYVHIANPTSENACDYSCLPYYKPFIADVAYGKDLNYLSQPYNFGYNIKMVKRADGLYQYAYNGKLLYRFTGDIKTGDINGLELFGKKDWEIVKI